MVAPAPVRVSSPCVSEADAASARAGGHADPSAADQQQRQFIRIGRPGAALTSLAVFGGFYLASPSDRLAALLGLLALALVVSLASIAAVRRFPLGVVARVSLGVDVVLIALMIAVLDIEALLVVPYFAPVAFSALMFGPVETLAFTALGIAGGVADGIVMDASTLTIAAAVLVLALTGAILAGLSHEFGRAQRRLARERETSATALRIAERMRGELDLNALLTQLVGEIGKSLDASRCVIRFAPQDGVPQPIFQWVRDGVAPVEAAPPRPLWKLFDERRPLAVGRRTEAEPELQAFMEQWDIEAIALRPIVWGESPLALLGVHDDRPRDWQRDGEPLLELLVPQIGAALAQAEAFARQEQTVERLEAVNRMREELVASVSHELRTPLTSTIGFLLTLERTDLELDAEHRTLFLATARREAERLARLVDDLLELSRLERGSFALQLERADLAHLVERAAAGVDVPVGRPLEVDVEEGLTAEVDADRIVQVFTNLIGNGFRHGRGAVSVTGGAGSDLVLVQVTDEGEGVPTDRLDQLFLPFARWSDERGSTGLGLAVSRRIAEAHGGLLQYRPATPTEPHAFVVMLPRA